MTDRVKIPFIFHVAAWLIVITILVLLFSAINENLKHQARTNEELLHVGQNQ